MKKVLEENNQQVLFRRIDALRFYGGDTRIRCSNGYMGRKSEDVLYGDKEAYRTLNALLFEGNKNEKERIWTEGHVLNPNFIRQVDKTVQIYIDIFILMKERRADFDYCITGKRVDRSSSVIYYENGFTQSFFSSSKCDYDSMFAQKNGIVLLEIELAENVPFIDYEKILAKEEYIHWDEREILLPPFLTIEMEAKTVATLETRIVKDQNKEPPQGKYQIKAIEFQDYRRSISESEEILWKQIIDGKESAANLLEKMNDKDEKQNYGGYVSWKEKLQKYLKIQFSNIWYGDD